MTDSERITVLVVDDHQITRSGLAITLQQYENIRLVGEAADGRAAVDQSLALHPDVILMDIAMPKMDGIDATREIKTKLPQTRVIMLTANDHEDDLFAALAAGADGYCVKNIEGKQLSIAIMAVQSGAAYLDPSVATRVMQSLLTVSRKTTDKSTFALSERELEVLTLVVEGEGNQDIADHLFISTDTVKTHMRHILEKLAVSDRTQAAVKAIRQGLV
jgi:two-component system, NarL family, response regulator LiaR